MSLVRRTLTVLAALPLATASLGVLPAAATPVCTDGYGGGPMREACGGRIFPEAHLTTNYVQFQPDPVNGFKEYQHGIEYMAQLYPRWVSVSTLRALTKSPLAVSAGKDGIRAGEDGDTGDGQDIPVIRLTDHQLPPAGKQTLFFSLSVHGNERGGLEGGLRAIEDLAMAATDGGTITDGYDNYESSTGYEPEFHTYEVKDVLAKEDVWFSSFNPDGWLVGDTWNTPAPLPYERGNGKGTDLNRQMPTVGRINDLRNPLQENEARYGKQVMDMVAAAGVGGKLAYGADIHGELTSRAYTDIMYPAGQYDSVKHRRLMGIAERTASVIDETMLEGVQAQARDQTGGDEGLEGPICDFVPDPDDCKSQIGNTVPTVPAHWATVWDTLGYTDTGFIGDYLATDIGVTGMDYEIFLNHTVPDKFWTYYLQYNHVNASRAIIKTAMAYALHQEQEFHDGNVRISTGGGRAGYVFNPEVVTDSDKNGPGTKPGPDGNGIGADGKPVKQRPYRATNMTFFEDTSRLMTVPFLKMHPADIAKDPKHLDLVDTLVLADFVLPKDALGRPVDKAAYVRNIGDWVKRGGNLILTDRAIHALGDLGIVDAGEVQDITVYQPYSDIDFTKSESKMIAGLRENARQLVEAAILGYGIGGDASPMTVVGEAAFTEAGGEVLGTTGDGLVSLGHVSVGGGIVHLMGGALPMPTEENDHRYGLRDYGMTYSGLFIFENILNWDVANLGKGVPRGTGGTGGTGGKGGGTKTPPIAATGWGDAAPALAALAFALAAVLRRRARARAS